MFKSKTLFIIGAGASCEAGLPSGEALKSRIAELLDIQFPDGFRQSSGDYQITAAFRKSVENLGFQGDINPLLKKAWRIRDVVPATAISIDNFLDAHQGDAQMELCGKLSIVKSILDAERKSKLCRTKEGLDVYNFKNIDQYNLKNMQDTWYVRFFQMLTENVPKEKVSNVFDNVSIITFNYDRCIERFLVQALSEYYELDISEAEQIVGKLPIYHPYGSIGSLPWQSAASPVSFGAETADLLSLSKRIKTFTEGLDDEKIIAAMHSTMANAETIIFLGFAFHPSNMQLLTPDEGTNAKRIFATTYGFSASDESVIQDDILRMLDKGPYSLFDEDEKIAPILANMTCNDFFKQYFRSLSAEISLKSIKGVGVN